MSSFHFRKMFSLDIFLTNQLDFTKTVIPLALIASETIAHSGSRDNCVIIHNLRYTVIGKASEDAFQALCIEIQNSGKNNTVYGTIYRQHNSRQHYSFQEYFDETLEKWINSNKSVYILGDFSINLLTETHDFCLSLKSFKFIPTINRPTRVDNNSATRISEPTTLTSILLVETSFLI